jgi:hypothetical protein
MLKSAAALMSIVLCAALLAACGDSGSDSSSTPTATVPTGKLGAAAPERCTFPRLGNGVTVTSLSATNMPCDVASNGLASVFRTNKFPGWTCTQSISGRNVRFTCTSQSDTTQTFSGGWAVS